MSEYHDIIERTIQKRKGGVEQSLRLAEAEYRELIAEVRVYNGNLYSCQEKEFRTVKALSNELASCHVTREKKKRTKKKLLVQKRGHKVASKGGSSTTPVSKLPTKQKDTHKAKHKSSTSQALHSSIPGTHLTPLSATAKCSTEDGIDALLAAGKPAQKEPTKTTNITESASQTSNALVPLWTPPTVSVSGTSKVTSAPVHKVHSTSVASKATSPTFVTKGKHDSSGKAGNNFSFNKGLKHDVQLFTILDTTVNPPLPRYIAKIVPESTALIPLNSSARNRPKVGSALTTLASTHASISSTHSTSSPTSILSSSTHPKSGPTTAIPRLSSGLAQSKGNSMTATSSKSAHKNTTSSNAMKSNAAPKKKVIMPITPPTVYACDQPGCRESFSQVELLNLHKLTFHRLVLPQLLPCKNPATRYNGSITRMGPQVVAAAHTLVDGSKKVNEKVSYKRVRSPSGTEEDSSGRKFIKLENGKLSLEPTSPVHNTAPRPWRNFARKSTGRSCSLKSKKVFVNRMQLKLRKVSTKGLKVPKRTVDQVKRQNCGPLNRYTTPHGYRNPEFFRNLIRSQLKLPTTNQKATATSDYISLQPDAEPTSVEQTNKTFPGPACKENKDSSVCARALPFIGNCARTRKFTPEVFSKPKTLSEQDRMMSSSTSSISTSIGEEMRVPSSEDESFPLVTLLPMVSLQQPSKESSNKISKLATFEMRAASPQPLSMDESAGAATYDVGWEGTIQSPPEHEKIQKETRISADPLTSIVSTKPKSPVIKSPSMMSPGVENNEYTMRLLQTIAKLSGDTSVTRHSCDTSVTGEKSRRSSVLSPPPPVIEDGESSDLDDEPCTSLVISVDLSRLSHVPVPPPPPPCPSLTEVGVFTHRVGSFTSRGAQVERGLIIDNDDLERRLTVKVNEALCEMKEKLQKTERRVRAVMKEKERLEKILEAKLKMIKDLTTTGIKPVFADKETMTDPVKEFTGNMKQIKSTMKSTTTQTIMSGPRAERRASGPSRCLSHLSDKELEQYLRVSPPTSAVQSEDDDDAIDVSNDVVPASSKNKWMFEPSDSARSSAFNLQVRFMRALMQNADDQNESTPSSMVSSSLLSRDLCSTFTKIQRLNQQLQVLPLVSVLKEKVDVVTSNVNHLLSHLPLPKGAEYEDLVLLMKLSIGTSAYNVGWKIKELLALLGDVNADRLPAYFKAELKLVMKHVRNALQFGESEMKNVTVDHTLRPLEQTPIRRLIDDDTCDSGDLDLDDMLSSSDDDEHQQKLDEEEVEVGGDRDLVARRPKPVRKLVQLGDRRNDKGQKKHRRRREKKTHSTKEGRPRHILSLPSLVEGKAAPVKGKPSLLRGYGGRFVKTNKPEKSKASKTSKKAPSTAVSKARSSPMSPAAIKKSVNRVVSQVNSRTPLILRKPAAVAKPAAVVTTPSNNGSSVTVTPINRPILPINSSNKHLSEPIKLLTSLAATMMSKGIPVGEAVTTSTASVSQPRVTHSTDTAVSSTTSSLKQVNSVGTNTSSGMCTSGRVEVSNLSSNTFTPIVKAISPTSTGPNGLRSATTPSSSKNQPISAVSAASRASQIQAGTQRRSNTATSTLSLSSSTLPPAVIAASSLLTLPPGPWNRLPISLPPSIVTASAIPALQNSARQGRAQSVTKAPAPLMRSSTLNGFPAPISRTSRLAMPSVTPPPSINMAPHFSFPMVAMNVTPLFSMPVVVPPGSVTVASPLTTPTVATPPVVAAALSHTPSAQTVAGPPPVSTAPSSSAAPPSATTVSAPPPISLETPNPGVSATTVSAPSSISLETPNPGVITTSSVSRPPSDTSTSFSEAPASPVLRSSINIEAATPTTCTVTPVEGTDVLPDLPESNSSTTVVVIDPLPEAEQPRPPPSPPPATVSHTAASSSSGSGSSSATLSADAVSSDPTDSKSNPVAVSLPSSLSSSESNSVDTAALSSSSSGKASPSLVEMLSSSSAALLTSFAAQGQNAPHSVITTTSPVPRCDDSPLALLEPQRFRNLLAQYSTHTVSMANREQSMSQGIQTLSSVSADSKHKPRRSSRIQNQASISSPSVAALKASIYKRRRNSPQRKASAPSSTKDTSTQDSHRLVALSPAPLTDTCMNHLATTLNANPTLEDLKMMYSQTLTDGTTVVSTAAASSSSATTAVIVIDDDNDKYTETAFSSEEVTTSASASLSTTVSQANPAISTESQQSSASPLENSISTPPISTAAPTSENNGISKPVSQDVSPISSPPPDSVTNGDFVFPDGINPHDVTPLVQVMHDEKGVLIKWTLPKKYLKLQEGVTAYELYAHIIKGRVEEEIPPVSDWSRVGKVKPLKLPMAVTLTNVIKTKKYFFSVRALFGSETCASQFSKPSCFREDSDNFPSTKFVGL